jgi:hypothetical protein
MEPYEITEVLMGKSTELLDPFLPEFHAAIIDSKQKNAFNPFKFHDYLLLPMYSFGIMG